MHGARCQKRPITVSKETYYSVKRDLLQKEEGRREGRGTLGPSHHLPTRAGYGGCTACIYVHTHEVHTFMCVCVCVSVCVCVCVGYGGCTPSKNDGMHMGAPGGGDGAGGGVFFLCSVFFLSTLFPLSSTLLTARGLYLVCIQCIQSSL